MTVFIDADGCHAVDITVKLTAEAGKDCIIICDTSHAFEKPGAKTITVSQGNDSVNGKQKMHKKGEEKMYRRGEKEEACV
jgi:uncharacterized protein YaiI (UPF0178 family)